MKKNGFVKISFYKALCLVLFLSLILFSCAGSIEKSMIFRPKAYSEGHEWKVPEGGQEVWINAADGTRLNAWFLVPDSNNDRHITIIYFHGNGGNITSYAWAASDLRNQGYSVFIYDYRGYGKSGGLIPDENAFYSDADAVYRFVTSDLNKDPARIVFYGFSLGTSVATEMALRHRCLALVLECGLTSVKDMAKEKFPLISSVLGSSGQYSMNNAEKIELIDCPVLVSHGESDDIIPVWQGKKLYELAKEPKRLAIYPGAGHNILAGAKENYIPILNEFIKEASGNLH